MRPFDFLRDRDWRNAVLKDGFGVGFWVFVGVAVLAGLACYVLKGPEAFHHALVRDIELVFGLVPRVFVAVSIAAVIWFLLPRERLSGLVGKESGIRGLVVATLAGAVTPGGPASAYSLLTVLATSGADRGAAVAYITAWATLGLQRVLVWDVPFMGAEFAILRIMITIPLPIVAGLIARRLPLTLVVKDENEKQEEVDTNLHK
ncbi:permease [Roseibium marinum]|uniref:Putative permease n=1 Tax=Roseibium marinum TaxID=281252 RepID=A0A2S3V3N4_9HYPH|nr:permease [Roseibium marinum]POF34525.1 putative permease [Roseibium marinum]